MRRTMGASHEYSFHRFGAFTPAALSILRLLHLAVALGILWAAAPAAAQTYTFTEIAREGDVAPGTGGAVFSTLAFPTLNASGEVAFVAQVTSGNGLFLYADGTLTALRVAGDPAPGTGGGTYSFFRCPSISDTGYVSYHAEVSGGTTSQGIFVYAEGTDRAVGLEGDAAPGTGGGTYSFPVSPCHPSTVDDSGDVAFMAWVDGSPVSVERGIFLDSGGSDSALVLEGDTAPGGGTYRYFDSSHPVRNGAGHVAFASVVSLGPNGVFVDTGGSASAVALEGQIAPGTGGMTYWSEFAEVALDAAGEVSFVASLIELGIDSGVFESVAGAPALVALNGQAAPGTSGTYNGFSGTSRNQPGDVLFRALFDEPSSYGTGLFLARGSSVIPLALTGSPAPGMAGETYWDVDHFGPALNDTGQVVFKANVTTNPLVAGDDVVLLATPPAVPALGPVGLFVVGASLLGFGAYFRGRA